MAYSGNWAQAVINVNDSDNTAYPIDLLVCFPKVGPEGFLFLHSTDCIITFKGLMIYNGSAKIKHTIKNGSVVMETAAEKLA